LHNASISNFPTNSNKINFDNYSTQINKKKTPIWTFKGSNQYFIEQKKIIDEKELVAIIEKALQTRGNHIVSNNIENKCIIGEKGMSFNEYNSITGVYYRIESDKIQIYIKTQITQDITGGAGNNLSKKLGKLIETALKDIMVKNG